MRDLVPAARERVFESMNDGVIVIDARRRIVDYNMAAAAICPGLAPQAIGAPASQALADMPALAAAIESGVGGERLNVASPPEPATYDVRLQPIRGTGGMTVGLAVVLTDITGQVTLVRKLQDLATIDELTGLANRRQFFDLGRREIARARREDRPISVALMDLDHFKHVNDRYGHAAGDEALKSVAEACRAAIRLSDLVGRYGGEELAFVFPDADARTAADVAERLRSAIAAAAIEHGGNRIAMTASFGVASSMRPARVDLESLLLCADRALYEAKRNGRNRVEVASVDAG
jgi:diguanylate cyclase (GGDEF)-like protein